MVCRECRKIELLHVTQWPIPNPRSNWKQTGWDLMWWSRNDHTDILFLDSQQKKLGTPESFSRIKSAASGRILIWVVENDLFFFSNLFSLEKSISTESREEFPIPYTKESERLVNWVWNLGLDLWSHLKRSSVVAGSCAVDVISECTEGRKARNCFWPLGSAQCQRFSDVVVAFCRTKVYW